MWSQYVGVALEPPVWIVPNKALSQINPPLIRVWGKTSHVGCYCQVCVGLSLSLSLSLYTRPWMDTKHRVWLSESTTTMLPAGSTVMPQCPLCSHSAVNHSSASGLSCLPLLVLLQAKVKRGRCEPQGHKHADGVPRAGQEGAVSQHKEAAGLAQPGGGDGGHDGVEGGGARTLGRRCAHRFLDSCSRLRRRIRGRIWSPTIKIRKGRKSRKSRKN